MVNLLLFFMVIAVLVAMIPAMNTMLNIAQQSDGLNCAGYVYKGNPNSPLSYNATLDSGTGTTLACLAINLYLPYIILVVLVAGVTKLISSRSGEAVM